jgi:hypothetical protein
MMPLNLVRATAQTAWPIPEMPGPEKPLTEDVNPSFPDVNPSFAVATINPRPQALRVADWGPRRRTSIEETIEQFDRPERREQNQGAASAWDRLLVGLFPTRRSHYENCVP